MKQQRAPWLILPLAAAAVAYVAIPFAALLQRAPWTDLGGLIGRPIVIDALRLSITTALAATGIALVLGIPLAWVLARTRFPGRSAARALVILPMVLPPVVGGAALLFAFGRRGLLGGPVYDSTGFLLPFSMWGVVAANTFVAMPFLVLTVESGLRAADPRYEDAAATLGASRSMIFRLVGRVTGEPSIRAVAATTRT